MKIIPKNIRWRSVLRNGRVRVAFVALLLMSVLLVFGLVFLADEVPADNASECLTGQITSFSADRSTLTNSIVFSVSMNISLKHKNQG